MAKTLKVVEILRDDLIAVEVDGQRFELGAYDSEAYDQVKALTHMTEGDILAEIEHQCVRDEDAPWGIKIR